jgi:hypothetical protein
VPGAEVRLDEREVRQGSGGRVPLELGERHHVVCQPILQAGVVDLGWLTAYLAGERADVVGDEPVHRWRRTGWRRVPRFSQFFPDLEAVLVIESV